MSWLWLEYRSDVHVNVYVLLMLCTLRCTYIDVDIDMAFVLHHE